MSDAVDESDPASLRAAWIEIGVVVAVTIVPHLVRSLASVSEGPTQPWPGSIGRWLAHGAASVGNAVAVLFVMARSGRPWSHYGFVRPRWYVDLPFAAALFALTLVVSFLTWLVVALFLAIPPGSGVRAPIDGLPNPALFVAVFGVAMLVNSVAEESAIRGFLIPRLLDVGWSGPLAVAVPSLLFAAYHVYQGLASAIVVAAMALVGSVIFLLSRRLWPFILAHTALNMYHLV